MEPLILTLATLATLLSVLRLYCKASEVAS